MVWKEMRPYRIAIWIGAIVLFLGALWWQYRTLDVEKQKTSKKEGFEDTKYVIKGPETENNAFYARVDLSCNALKDCISCTTQAPTVKQPNGQMKMAKCGWCPSKNTCMVNLPAYVTDLEGMDPTDLSANTINNTLCDWASIQGSEYQCKGLAEKALAGTIFTRQPLPPSQREQDFPTPLLPRSERGEKEDKEEEERFNELYPPTIGAPGIVRPANSGSIQPTFPAAANPVGWDANNGPFEEYIKMLVHSELVTQGIPVTEGFQGGPGGTLDAVVSNVERFSQTRRT